MRRTTADPPDSSAPRPHGPARIAERGLTRVKALIVLGVVVALFGVSHLTLGPPTCDFGVTLPLVARAKGNHRAIATALETYCVNHGFYPAAKHLRPFAPDPKLLDAAGGAALEMIDPDAGRAWSDHGTSPPPPPAGTANLMAPPLDPFTGTRRKSFPGLGKERLVDPWTYAYYRSPEPGSGWIVWSPGPDGVYDIRDPASLYDPGKRVPSDELIDATYDPTNGDRSRGDVYRVKQ